MDRSREEDVLPVDLCNASDRQRFVRLGDKAYRDMRTSRKSQSIIVSGESGAGQWSSDVRIDHERTDF
jgi:hypothetical protein